MSLQDEYSKAVAAIKKKDGEKNALQFIDAVNVNIRPELRAELAPILAAIRISENGRAGREYGVLHPKAVGKDYRTQAAWSAATVQKNYDRWVKAGSEGEFVVFLGNRYAPENVANDPTGLNSHWIKNVRTYSNKFTDSSDLPITKPVVEPDTVDITENEPIAEAPLEPSPNPDEPIIPASNEPREKYIFSPVPLELSPHPDGPKELKPVEDMDGPVAEGSPYKIRKTIPPEDIDWSKHNWGTAWAGTSPEDPAKDIQNPFNKGGVADITDPIGDIVLGLLGFETKKDKAEREERNRQSIKNGTGIELSPELSEGQDLVFETLKHHLESGMSTDIVRNWITGEDNISREYKPDPEFSWFQHQTELEDLTKIYPSEGYAESIQNSRSLKEAQARGEAAKRTLGLYEQQSNYFGNDGIIDSGQQMAFNLGFALVDPINVVPVGGVAAAGKIAGRFITGATKGARAARIGIQSGAGAAEGMLWAKAYSERSDPLRADPHYGVAAGLGTLLGAGVGGFGERRGPTQKRLYEGFERKVKSAPNTAAPNTLILDKAGKVVDLSPRTTAAGVWNKYTPKEKAFWASENIKRRGIKIDPDRIDMEIDAIVKSVDNKFGVSPEPAASPKPAAPEKPSMVRIDVEGTEEFARAREAEFEFLHQKVTFDDLEVDPIVVEQLRDLVEEANSGKVISKQDIDAAVSPPEQGAGFRLVDDTKPLGSDIPEPKKEPSLYSPSTEFKKRNSKELNKENFSRRIDEVEPFRPRKDTLFLLTVGRKPVKMTEPQPFGTLFSDYRGAKKSYDVAVEKNKSYGPVTGQLNPTPVGMISRQLPSKFVTIFLPKEAQNLVNDPMKFLTALIETKELGGKLKLPKATHDGLVDIKFNMAKEMGGNKDLSDRASFLPQTGGRLNQQQVSQFGHRITQFLVEQGFDGFTFLTDKGKPYVWSVFQPEVLFTPDFRRPDYLVNFGDQLPKPKTVLAKEAIEDIKKAITDKYRTITVKNPPVEDVNSLKVIERILDEKLKQDKLDRAGGELFDGVEATSKDIDAVGDVIPFENPIDSLTLKDYITTNVDKWFRALIDEGDGEVTRMSKWLEGGKDELLDGIQKKVLNNLFSNQKIKETRKIAIRQELHQIRVDLRDRFPEAGALTFDDFYNNAMKDWVVKTFTSEGQFIDTSKDPFLSGILDLLKKQYKTHDDNLRKRIVRNNTRLKRNYSDDAIDDTKTIVDNAGNDGDAVKRQMEAERDAIRSAIAEDKELIKSHKDLSKKIDGEEGGVGFISKKDEIIQDIMEIVRLDMSKSEGLNQPINERYPIRSKVVDEYDRSFYDLVGVDDELARMRNIEGEIISLNKDLAVIDSNIADKAPLPDKKGFGSLDPEIIQEGVIKYISETDIGKLGFKDFDDFFTNELSTWFKDSFVDNKGFIPSRGKNASVDILMSAYKAELDATLADISKELLAARKKWSDGDRSARIRGYIATLNDSEAKVQAKINDMLAWKNNDLRINPNTTFYKDIANNIKSIISKANDTKKEIALKTKGGMRESIFPKEVAQSLVADRSFPKEADIRASWDKGPNRFAADSAEINAPNLERLASEFNELKVENLNLKVDKFFYTPEGRLQISKLETEHNLPVGGLTAALLKRILKPDEEIKFMFAGPDTVMITDMLKHFTKLTGKGIRALRNVFKKIREFFIGIPRGNNKGSVDFGGIFGAGKKKKRVVKDDFLDQWGKDETGLIPSIPSIPLIPLKKLISWSRSRRARTQSNEVGFIRVLGQWAYGSERFRIKNKGTQNEEVNYAGAKSDRVSIQQGIVKNRMKKLGDFKTRLEERKKESEKAATKFGFRNAEELNNAIAPIIFKVVNLSTKIKDLQGQSEIKDFPDLRESLIKSMKKFISDNDIPLETGPLFTAYIENIIKDVMSLDNGPVGNLPKNTPFLDGSPLLNWNLFRDLNQLVVGDDWLTKIMREVVTAKDDVTKNFATVFYKNQLRDNQNLKPIKLTTSKAKRIITTEVLEKVNKLGKTNLTKEELIDQVKGAFIYLDTEKVISSVDIDPIKVTKNLEGERVRRGAFQGKLNSENTKLEDFTLTDLMSHDLFDTLEDLGTGIIDNNLQRDILAEFKDTLKGFGELEGIPKNIRSVEGMFNYLAMGADELSKRGAITNRKEFDTMLALLRADLTGDRPSTKLHNSVVTLQKVASATSVLGFALPAVTEMALPIFRNLPRTAKRLVGQVNRMNTEGSIDFIRSAGVGTDSALFATTGSNRRSVIFDDNNPMRISKKPDLELGPNTFPKRAGRIGGKVIDNQTDFLAGPLMGITSISQRMALNSITSRILDKVLKFGDKQITTKNIKDIIDPRLTAQMGWNPEDTVAIYTAIQKSLKGRKTPDDPKFKTKLWNLDEVFSDIDVGTKERFSAGLYSWVSQNIVRPDMGDMPLFLDNAFVKVLGQFRGFGIAQYSKFTAPLIQRTNINPKSWAPFAFLLTNAAISGLYAMANYTLYNPEEGLDDMDRFMSGRNMKNNLWNAFVGGVISPFAGPVEFAAGIPLEMLGISIGTEWYDQRYSGKYGPAEDLARQSAAFRTAINMADPIRKTIKNNDLEDMFDGDIEGPFDEPVKETLDYTMRMLGLYKLLKLGELVLEVAD